MTIRVVAPVTPTASSLVVRQRPLHAGIRPSEQIIGLIDNGKFLADELLLATSAELARRGYGVGFELLRKPAASRAVTIEERAQLLARARIVLTGVGD